MRLSSAMCRVRALQLVSVIFLFSFSLLFLLKTAVGMKVSKIMDEQLLGKAPFHTAVISLKTDRERLKHNYIILIKHKVIYIIRKS